MPPQGSTKEDGRVASLTHIMPFGYHPVKPLNYDLCDYLIDIDGDFGALHLGKKTLI
jgi:hypothetical protein